MLLLHEINNNELCLLDLKYLILYLLLLSYFNNTLHNSIIYTYKKPNTIDTLTDHGFSNTTRPTNVKFGTNTIYSLLKQTKTKDFEKIQSGAWSWPLNHFFIKLCSSFSLTAEPITLTFGT